MGRTQEALDKSKFLTDGRVQVGTDDVCISASVHQCSADQLAMWQALLHLGFMFSWHVC